MKRRTSRKTLLRKTKANKAYKRTVLYNGGLLMGDGSTSTLIAALRLDEHPLLNQFMYVEEQSNADGSFILSAIIKYQIERNNNVILVSCHHSLGHFHSISQKLGYNLFSLKEEVYMIDVLDKIINENFLLSTDPLKQLYIDIKKQLDIWGNEKGACIIVENLGNILLANTKDCLTFVQCLRGIALDQKNSSFVLSLHNFPECSDFSFLTKSIRHLADITVLLRDLQTGRANDVTGHLTVIRKEKYMKNKSEYQYQLQDKSVSVFTPGSRSFL